MRRILGGYGALLRGAMVLLASVAEPVRTSPWFRPLEEALIPAGRFVYKRNYRVCHGRWGDRKGELTPGMWPLPRKLSAGVFKYRTTPSGALPADADLERPIRGGIYGSSIPVFGQLEDREIRAVISYVKTFSSQWDTPQNFAAPLPIPNAPDWLADDKELAQHALKGGIFFRQACAACHGSTGKGDGSAVAALEDDWGNPRN